MSRVNTRDDWWQPVVRRGDLADALWVIAERKAEHLRPGLPEAVADQIRRFGVVWGSRLVAGELVEPEVALMVAVRAGHGGEAPRASWGR